MNRQNELTYKIKKLSAIAVFAALAYVVHFVHIPVLFLNLDFKDVIMAIGGMYFGPLSALVLAVLVPLLELPTSSTELYGLIMNIFGSVSFVFTASLIYKFRKTLGGAIAALCTAAVTMVAVMMVANLYVTPYYMGVSQATVVDMIPKLLLPFNATKAILNASLTLCLYKPVTRALKASGLGKKQDVMQPQESKGVTLRSVLVWIIGGAIAVGALLVIFFVLGGSIAFN